MTKSDLSKIPTATLNSFFRTIRARNRKIPANSGLLALTMLSIVERLGHSSRNEDKQLLRWIEGIKELECYLESENIDIWEELNKENNGIFGPRLRLLPFLSLREKVSVCDDLVIRMQYAFLNEYVKRHPVPTRLTPPKRDAWLRTHWDILQDNILRGYSCHCEYDARESEWPDVSQCETQKELLICLLAHLHHSTPGGIDQYLKRKRSTPLPRLSITR